MMNDRTYGGDPPPAKTDQDMLLSRLDLPLTEAYEPPIGPIEDGLERLCASQLKFDKVGRNDDFFELGGDSFAAVQLALAIESAFGRTFSAAQFIDYPSIARQAEFLGDGAANPSGETPLPSCVSLGQKGTSGRPLFMVHGGLGMTFLDRRFLEGVGRSQTIYLFQAPGLDGNEKPLSSVEEYAATYAAAMRKIQPKGPYAVSANCASSVIGLEIAFAIQAQGEVLDPLILLDPHPVPPSLLNLYPGLTSRYIDKKRTLGLELKKFFLRFRNLVRGHGFVVESSDFTWRNSIDEAARRHRVARKRQQKLHGLNPQLAESAGSERDLSRETLEKLDAAIRNYVPGGRLKGTLRVLGSSGRSYDDPEQLRFWRAAATEVDLHLSPGTHKDVFIENSVLTGNFVRKMLDIPLSDNG